MSDNLPPVIPTVTSKFQQKLMTIYLDNTAYAEGKMLVGSFGDKHGLVEEHLAPLLADGWRVAEIRAFGGNSDGLAVRGWLAVVLEKG
jgi:hypothetical protein